MKDKFTKLASQSLFVGCLMMLGLPVAWGCTVGDQKCGTDGYVMECYQGPTDYGSVSVGAPGWKCPRDENCWVSTRGYFYGDYRSGTECGIKNVVCEPGIRRCRAGYVQECNDDGSEWDNVTHEKPVKQLWGGYEHESFYTKCDGHDISQD